MIRTSLLLSIFFLPIFAASIEFKDVKMAGKPELWQKQLDQEGREGWRFVEVNDGWAMFTRNTKTPVNYYFTKVVNQATKQQPLVEKQAQDGWHFHGRYDSWFIFSQAERKTDDKPTLQCKFIKRSDKAEVWQRQVTQEGRESWTVVDTDNGWFTFMRNADAKTLTYKFLKAASSSTNRRTQIEGEAKDNWVYLLRLDGWLIFAK